MSARDPRIQAPAGAREGAPDDARELLRLSEERFRLMVESVRDYAIFMLDVDGHVTSWNKGAELNTGYSADEITGKHFSVFYPQDKLDARWPQHELEVALRDGRFEDEGWRLRKDGSRFWSNVVITALHDSEGRHRGFVKVTRDLTASRRIHALEEQERRLTQFLALPDSGLGGDPSRLAGTTVALNTLGNLGELALRETLADAGLEFTDVTAVEIPFPDMGAALDGGNVNVIWASEPGVSGNKAELGAVTVIDSYVDDMEGFPVAGYFVTGDFARQNPNTVAAFARAVQAAASMLSDDPELPARVAATYTELPADVLAGVSFPEYRGTLEAALLERVYRKMLEHGMIQEGLDIGSLVGG